MSDAATTRASGDRRLKVLRDLPRDSAPRTLLTSLIICLVCSAAVSASTVILRPIRMEHQRRARQERVAAILSAQPALRELIGDPKTAALEQMVVHLPTGAAAADIDADLFDPVKSATDPATSRAVPSDRDVARIQRTALHAVVTVIRRQGAVHAVVLPAYGRGYGSVIRGAIAVVPKDNEIVGLVIVEHGETPGLGDEIEDADWRKQWVGKRIWGPTGEVQIRVTVDEPAPADAVYHVEGISGATKSSLGVGDMIRFWLGPDGFGPFLDRLRKGELP